MNARLTLVAAGTLLFVLSSDVARGQLVPAARRKVDISALPSHPFSPTRPTRNGAKPNPHFRGLHAGGQRTIFHRHRFHHFHRGVCAGAFFPFSCCPICGGYFNCGCWHGGFGFGVVFPPVIVPADELFGPRAVRRFWGFDQAANEPARREFNFDGDDRLALRSVNAQVKARAAEFVKTGDAKFHAARYREALERYRQAAQSMPNWAEVHFRQGHALAALGQFAQSAAAYRRGLEINPKWAYDRFRFDTLYGSEAEKKAVRERLMQVATRRAYDVDVALLLGIQFYFDEQRQQAREYFRQVQRLDPTAKYLDAFLAESASPASNEKS